MKFFVNFLSAFRIAASFAIIGTLMAGWAWVSFILFALAAISDFFDGWLARKYNVCTKIGGVADHIGDKLLVVNTLIMLTILLAFQIPFMLPHVAPWMIAIPTVLMIARELYISGLREFIGTQKMEMPVPKPRFSMGKIKTTFQMVAIAALLLMLCVPSMITMSPVVLKYGVRIFLTLGYIGVIGLWISLVASLWSATQYTITFLQKIKTIK